MKQWWNDSEREKKPVPVPLNPPQIPHGLDWNITIPQSYV